MIQNIFLIRGIDQKSIDNLSIFYYPQDIITKDKTNLEKLFLVHDTQSSKNDANDKNDHSNQKQIQIYDPIPHKINNLNTITIKINDHVIIGLIFDMDDNPHDYELFFKELMHELINNEKRCSFHEEFEIENLMITAFVDFRRYDDELMQKQSGIEISKDMPFNKIFIFGLDEVGKSSLVRRIKTGEYADNYFTPTKKFNIQYIKDEEKGLLALWDMPGQHSFRKKWLTGSQDSNILVYMFDVSDQIRFAESRKELDFILDHYELSEVPVLIIGNKVDLVNHVNIKDIHETKKHLDRLRNEIFDYFKFHDIGDRTWKFLFSSVKTNYNIDHIIDSILDLVSI